MKLSEICENCGRTFRVRHRRVAPCDVRRAVSRTAFRREQTDMDFHRVRISPTVVHRTTSCTDHIPAM